MTETKPPFQKAQDIALRLLVYIALGATLFLSLAVVGFFMGLAWSLVKWAWGW